MGKPSARALLKKIHARNPFQDFDANRFSPDLSGWGGTDPHFKTLIEEVRPRLVIEVGTWKGASAVFMGKHLQAAGGKSALVCVDTWLGALEFWTDQKDETRYRALGLKNGYPSVYYQFLANVVHEGLQDVIVPFPQTSAIAARWFKKNRLAADLIYIDASHDEDDVLSDLRSYWDLVSDGGILFGDDYNWPGVRAAVNYFAFENNFAFELAGLHWVFRKSKQPRPCRHWRESLKTAARER
jgi:hypothetical protein